MTKYSKKIVLIFLCVLSQTSCCGPGDCKLNTSHAVLRRIHCNEGKCDLSCGYARDWKRQI